jgi:hypothetical protein
MAIAIPIAALALTAVGTGVAADSAIQSSAAQKSSADYNAQVAKNNAQLASQNATVAVQQGDVAAQQQYLEGTQRMGGIIAAQAANGIQVNSGSALQVQGDQARTTQQNVQATQYNALDTATGFRNQAIDFGSQSGLDTAEGQNDATAGALGATSSIIGGASSVSSKWASYQQNGAFNLGSGSSATTPTGYSTGWVS